ncbi:hypothetical protein TrRE_jg160, partial [Triparma retinervis]
MIPRNTSRSQGFSEIESSLVPSQPDGGQRKTAAGMAGGRGGRVIRRNDSLSGPRASSDAPSSGRQRTGSASSDLTEADRPRFKKLVEDTANLVKWFNADPVEGGEGGGEISLGDFKDACRSLGIDFGGSTQLVQLCENDDLSTSVRAVQLLNGKASAVIKELDDVQRKEREARKAERALKKAKAEAEKKARKEAKEKAKRDADNILQIEASIVLTLEKGCLPTAAEAGRGRCSQETMFYRYNDRGLQFQFGSADFASMTFRQDGTFEFKNGYKMEFSSARQFVEQSEGLFDDLRGTYDIVWGEMRGTAEGGKARRVAALPQKAEKEETRQGQQAPRRPGQRGKQGSMGARGSFKAVGSIRGIGRMGSSLMKKMGSVRFGGGGGGGG